MLTNLNIKNIYNFQNQVFTWAKQAFGLDIAYNTKERNYRFMEEAIELVQSNNISKEDVLKLADYVYSRPKGERYQEIGGVFLTLCALCSAYDEDLYINGNLELNRVYEKIDLIREKQKQKPKLEKLSFTDIS